MCLTARTPSPKSRIYWPPLLPLWISSSELSERLSPGLYSSVKSPNKTETHSSHIVHFFSVHIWFMFISGWWNDRYYSGSPHNKPICFHQTPLCYETSSLWFPECPHNESIGHKLKVGWYIMIHLSCINLVANDVCHVEVWWTFSNIIVVYYWFIEHS